MIWNSSLPRSLPSSFGSLMFMKMSAKIPPFAPIAAMPTSALAPA
jgi:hypothetical protein